MSVNLTKLTMRYAENTVVDALTASFRPNAISVLLGPSGCGKTTTLRCIAGLETPADGSIHIDGDAVFDSARHFSLPPEQRGLGMVFQSYAIWPHMTVFENVALPLRAQGLGREAVRTRVEQTLSLVGLAAMSSRSATQLSGGQQQRVAIARCVAARPKLMLLDEPLSNLDAKLRVEMRHELKTLQQQTGLTMLFVTHDQEEAMMLADEIFLFRDGKIAQHGSPQDLYWHPHDRYVAEFLGKANLFPVVVRPGSSEVQSEDGQHLISAGTLPVLDEQPGTTRICLVRPEAWSFVEPSGTGLPGRIATTSFLGDRIELGVETPSGRLLVQRPGHEAFAIGQEVRLRVQADHLYLLP
jgi:iron(III) transport system ATP-binding protein